MAAGDPLGFIYASERGAVSYNKAEVEGNSQAQRIECFAVVLIAVADKAFR